jgi:hypothetical protein
MVTRSRTGSPPGRVLTLMRLCRSHDREGPQRLLQIETRTLQTTLCPETGSTPTQKKNRHAPGLKILAFKRDNFAGVYLPRYRSSVSLKRRGAACVLGIGCCSRISLQNGQSLCISRKEASRRMSVSVRRSPLDGTGVDDDDGVHLTHRWTPWHKSDAECAGGTERNSRRACWPSAQLPGRP